MNTVDERLRFAVQFAQMDLDRLRAGDWLNLRDDLMQFLLPVGGLDMAQDPLPVEQTGGILPHGSIEPLPGDMTPEDFRQLQTSVRTMLEDLFPVTDAPRGGEAVLGSLSIEFRVFRWAGEPTLMALAGHTHDVVLLTLALLLIRSPKPPIGRCPECQTLFSRVRKQQYCSPRCGKRASMRGWRQTATGQQYERERSQKRYEAEVKKTRSKNVKVKRRTHSGNRTQGRE